MVSTRYTLLSVQGYSSVLFSLIMCFVDAFIITGSYFKTGNATSFVDRISNTMKDCSISIFVTTLTTSLAFCLSLFSEIPAIYNFSAYAIISVWVDFLYQITFFIAIMKLNEERIQNQRYDLFPCCIRQSSNQLCDGNTGVDTVNEMVMKRFAQTITVLSRKQRLLVVLGKVVMRTFRNRLCYKMHIIL